MMCGVTTAVQKAPRISLPEAAEIASHLYGLNARALPLPSERDQNFQLQTPAGEKFVLKIANAKEDLEFLKLQNELIRLFGAANIDLEFPRIVSTTSGEDIASITAADSRKHFVRLLSWLDGDCFAEVQPHGRKLLRSVGRALAQMDAALTTYDHPAAHRSFYWDLRNADAARGLAEILPIDRRAMVERFFTEWEKIDWGSLRFSVIHNDANDYNLLVTDKPQAGNSVTAIIDYGDVVHSATVCNLA